MQQHCIHVRKRPLWRRHSGHHRQDSNCDSACPQARTWRRLLRRLVLGRRVRNLRLLRQAAGRRAGRLSHLRPWLDPGAARPLCRDLRRRRHRDLWACSRAATIRSLPLEHETMYTKGNFTTANTGLGTSSGCALGISMPGMVAYSRTGMTLRTALASACTPRHTDVRNELSFSYGVRPTTNNS